MYGHVLKILDQVNKVAHPDIKVEIENAMKVLQEKELVVPEDSKRIEGWAMPPGTRKYHYFRNHSSLCNKWMFPGKIEEKDSRVQQSTGCQTCMSKLIEEKK